MEPQPEARSREEAPRLPAPEYLPPPDGVDPADYAAAVTLYHQALQDEMRRKPRAAPVGSVGPRARRVAFRRQAVWTVKDVCVILQLHDRTVQAHCRRGAFPGAYLALVHLKNQWRIPWAAVTAFQLAQMEATRARILRQRARRAAKAAAGSTAPPGPRGASPPST